MELKQIKELMATMERTGVTKVVIKRPNDIELELERAQPTIVQAASYSENPLRTDFERHRAIGVMGPTHHQQDRLEEKVEPIEDVSNLLFVTSPMVGTFYQSPSPQDPAFVKVGDRVEKNTVVCIIEAMKVMNEVKAGVAGVIKEVLVDNNHPVEFSTKLYSIIPD